MCRAKQKLLLVNTWLFCWFCFLCHSSNFMRCFYIQGGPPKTAHFWWPLGRPVSTLSTCPVCQINRTLQELRSRGFSARSDNFGAPHKRFCEKVRFLRSFQGTKKCLRIWTKNSLLFDKLNPLRFSSIFLKFKIQHWVKNRSIF